MNTLQDRAQEWGPVIDWEVADSYDVAVVDPDPAVRAHLAEELGLATAVFSPDTSTFADRHPAGQRLVAIFGPGLADGSGLASIDRLTRGGPEIGAILVVPELSTALFQEALRSGVRDVLALPVEPGALAESVDRVGRSLVGTPPPSPGKPEQGEVVTVSSMKGGSGKTVVATNLAVALARRSEQPVALVDADLQFGDVAVMLRLNAPHTIIDAILAMDQLDAQFLRSLLVRHEPSGLHVQTAP